LLRALAQREREIERASERAIARQRKRVRGGFGWWSEEPNQLIKSYDFTRLLIEKYRFFFSILYWIRNSYLFFLFNFKKIWAGGERLGKKLFDFLFFSLIKL
jgi:hypothetical protein